MPRTMLSLKESTLIPLTFLLCSIAASHFAYQLLPKNLQSLIAFIPYIIFSLAALLSIVYARLRIFMTVLILVFNYWLLGDLLNPNISYWDNFTIEFSFNAATFLGPINIALFAYWSEKGSFLTDILSKVFVLSSQIAVIVLLSNYQYLPALEILTLMAWPLDYPSWLNISPLSFISFILAFTFVFIKTCRQPTKTNSALLFSLLCLFFAFQQLLHPGYLVILMAASGLFLMGSMIHEGLHMAFKDELTNLPGRRALNEQLAKLGRQYTLAMLDVDHFKKFNDTYGHDLGDYVLKIVAQEIQKVSGGGRAFRYGGEEFTIVFLGKNKDDVLGHLEDIRELIAQRKIPVKNQKQNTSKPVDVSVTISIGVAQRTGDNKTPEHVLKAADEALYRAKRGGRNQVST